MEREKCTKKEGKQWELERETLTEKGKMYLVHILNGFHSLGSLTCPNLITKYRFRLGIVPSLSKNTYLKED